MAFVRVLFLVLVLLLVAAAPAAAMTMLSFETTSGQFSMTPSGAPFSDNGGVIDFGDGITISAAVNTGGSEPALVGFAFEIAPLQLQGGTADLGGGVTQFSVVTASDTPFSIFDGSDTLIFDGQFEPIALIVEGNQATLSVAVQSGVNDLTVFDNSYATLNELFALEGTLDIVIDFAAAPGVDIADQLINQNTVYGTLSGKINALPEPGIAVLMGTGLLAAALRAKGRGQA